MMSDVIYNAITYASRLKSAGVPSDVADIHAEEISNIINNEIATKKDLLILKNEIVIKLGSIVIGSTVILSIVLGVLGFVLKI